RAAGAAAGLPSRCLPAEARWWVIETPMAAPALPAPPGGLGDEARHQQLVAGPPGALGRAGRERGERLLGVQQRGLGTLQADVAGHQLPHLSPDLLAALVEAGVTLRRHRRNLRR